jgi:hypothetical protein
MNMRPKDKVNFIAHIVGRLPTAPADKITHLPSAITTVSATVREKFSGMTREMAETIATDLVVSDVLDNGSSLDRLVRFCQQAEQR